MANKVLRGDSQPVAQVTTITIAGSPATNDTDTATINRKEVTYTELAGSPTVTTEAAGLAAALSGDAPAEFQEANWTSAAGVVTGTAAVPGVPFTVTASETGGGTIAVATPVASAGPQHVDDPDNWNPAIGLPAAADDVLIDVPAGGALYGLANFPAVALGAFTVLRGQVGLPDQNPGGYVEYRTKILPLVSATAVRIGNGTVGPTLCRLSFTATTPVHVDTAGSGAVQPDGAPIRLTNSGGAIAVTLTTGYVGLATGVGEVFAGSAVVGTLGPDGSFGATDEQARLEVGAGATLSTLTIAGGTVDVAGTVSGATTMKDGTLTARDGSAWGGFTVTGGTVLWQTNAALGTATFTGPAVPTGPATVLDLSGDTRAVTGTLTFTRGARLIDPNRRLAGQTVTFDRESLAVADLGFDPLTVTL